MEQAKQLFKQECDELLQEMEEGLLQLEDNPQDMDSVGAVFRAAHTIKGSSGIFGFDDIVAFAHVAENLLDLVRAGELPVTGELIAVLLESGDYLGELVAHFVVNDERPDEAVIEVGQGLIKQLNTFMGREEASSPDTRSMPVEHEGTITAELGSLVETDNWHISLRFGPDVLRNGMDPLSIIQYLATLGELVGLTTLFDEMPEAAEMDPETCYLGFEIAFHSDADKEAIENVFEFVRNDCQLRLIPPHSNISHYIELIQALPEDDMRLGEILIKSKALTERELQDALAQQSKQEASAPPIGELLVNEGVVNEKVVAVAVDKQADTRSKKLSKTHSVRVDANKLDQLINLVGELVIAGARSYLLAQRNGDDDLVETVSDTSRLVEEIRDSALRLRMVQIGETFNRFRRVVRDVSKEMGKDIKLMVEGGDTELDKTVVEKISDPLMHLVRNAIDHGIEPEETRLANGKSSLGVVTLNAYHDSGSIVIEVRDDGGGLNRDKILAKAKDRGLVAANQNLTDQEVYRLIFEAGFSTADQVTNISGRGVGMDVVRRNVEALRGSITVASEQGLGTTIRIRLPLTLAIIDGFLVGVGDASYVVPLDMVVECVELSEHENDGALTHQFINLRGEVLPFVRLNEMFADGSTDGGQQNLVVVQYAGQKAGLVVDRLLGEFQTVIKPLGKIFQSLRGISGATILGSGDVAVILDVPNLIQQSISAEIHENVGGVVH
ncbi:MAG: chemotaxis protein CheA [Gammaproteobacteria bacterium]|nr:chemotaxis protein CheA [Gammaproteobacteria bacterium]